MRFRVYFQMTLQEIADTLGCSVTAVHREVAFARAFLLQTSR
jgi:DNA-directed RNA polymerase specialized sigma24 family protein